MIDAIVLAGAANTGKLREVSSASAEAIIPVAGRPMLWYVVNALHQSTQIGRVIVVGPPEVAQIDYGPGAQRVVHLPSGSSMVENLLRAVDYVKGESRVLVVTSDIPLLTAEAVDDFIERCKATEADIYYPIVSKETNEAKYPGVQRTYVKLLEGTYTGGNLALVAPEALIRGRRVIEQAFLMRKKPIKLARLLGFRFILKFILNRLSLHEIEQRVTDILGCSGRAVVSPFPEVGIDVDKPSDMQVVEQELAAQGDTTRHSAGPKV